MAATLTDIWNRHALSGKRPAKEMLWAREAERRSAEIRRDIYLELSGADLKMRRYTSGEGTGPDGRAGKGMAMDGMTLLAIGSPAWRANYNNPAAISVGGETYRFSQGQWHEIARKYRDKVERDINKALARGAGWSAPRF
ncbi:MAG: hypothetical protein HYZ11_18805 [Candidatus Tectomicrobia bacterium]|uniref:Uncharacterized protein n=1 Tax=Tectimicrobiota bacterium TaxID=2528274 RepID=A0A932I5U5_UNCTE|nr:hypothetical protein [Candidatus Tectomicrobia bacterium]